MKKVFTLMLALFAMVAIQAQSLLSEDFENGIPSTWLNIDADNDGYAWMEGTAPGVSGHNGSNGCAYSCSYYDGTVLTPNNWLITPAINLTANADLTFWVAAQDASYAAEHYGVYISTTGTATSNFTLLFEETIDANGGSRVQGTWKQKTVNLANYTGQTVYIAFRHFNCTDMFYFNLDDVEIFAQPTDPTISVVPSTIDFGSTMLGTSKTSSAVVTAYNLTTGITATTAAPFEVSADGTNFGTMASLAAAGGTLHVRYTPTAITTDNGTITLTSTGASNVTMTLSGAGMDCNGTVPYSYSFTDEAANQCWTIVDANEDGYTFSYNTADGEAQYSYNYAAAADDWLISPVFTLTGNETGSFDYRAYSASYPEKFQVFAIGTDTVALTSIVDVTSTAPTTQYFGFTNLTGAYQIGIHCVSEANMWKLLISNFSISNDLPQASMTFSESSMDFATVPVGNTSAAMEVTLSTVNMNEAITLTTAAPFEISLDGTNFAATQTIPANSSLSVDDVIYVRFAPTASGPFTQNLTATATNLNATVALSGNGVECNVISTFPFTETFNEDSPTKDCWIIVDANNDDYSIEYLPYDDENTGVAAYFYNSYNDAEDWLISPEFALPAGGVFLSYEYAIASSSYPEKYSVWAIPQNGTYSDAINILPTQTIDVDGLATNFLDLSSYANQTIRIAFKVESDADMYYIYFDNVMLSAAGETSLTVDPTSMSFSGLVSTPTEAQTANVVGLSLSNDITITATAPFEVSTNGTTFSSTGTIAQATIVNAPIYVRMNASTAGVQTGTVTLTSGSTTATINVTGTAIDCSNANALPFFEGFEDGIGACYRNIDNDGDGYTWVDNIYTEWPYEPYEGVGCAMSASYINGIGALYPDNYLITPALAIPSQGAKVSWYVAAQDGSYAEEVYDVMVSTTPNNLNSFTSIFSETLETNEWEMRTANIPSSFNGQNVYVAFRHHDVTDMFWMKIDNLSVTAGTGVEDHELSTTIFPNPANNVLNINANCNINRVEVYNMMGQMVGIYDVNDMNTQINTMSFANGVYTVRIATENGMSTKKFTVAR